LVADEPSAFAAACLRLLRQPALGRRLAAGGRRLVHRLYRWERNAAGLERVMRQTLRRALW
jgi:glycosyltransferase involved in cell wall biosynthesis